MKKAKLPIKNPSLLEFLTKIKDRRNHNLVMFEQAHDEIKRALNLNFSSREIWRGLYETKKFFGSYETFRRLLHGYLVNLAPK